VHVVNQFAVIY